MGPLNLNLRTIGYTALKSADEILLALPVVISAAAAGACNYVEHHSDYKTLGWIGNRFFTALTVAAALPLIAWTAIKAIFAAMITKSVRGIDYLASGRFTSFADQVDEWALDRNVRFRQVLILGIIPILVASIDINRVRLIADDYRQGNQPKAMADAQDELEKIATRFGVGQYVNPLIQSVASSLGNIQALMSGNGPAGLPGMPGGGAGQPSPAALMALMNSPAASGAISSMIPAMVGQMNPQQLAGIVQKINSSVPGGIQAMLGNPAAGNSSGAPIGGLPGMSGAGAGQPSPAALMALMNNSSSGMIPAMVGQMNPQQLNGFVQQLNSAIPGGLQPILGNPGKGAGTRSGSSAGAGAPSAGGAATSGSSTVTPLPSTQQIKNLLADPAVLKMALGQLSLGEKTAITDALF